MVDVPYPATLGGMVLLAVKAAPPAAIAPISTTTATILLEMRCIVSSLIAPGHGGDGRAVGCCRPAKSDISVAVVIVHTPQTLIRSLCGFAEMGLAPAPVARRRQTV